MQLNNFSFEGQRDGFIILDQETAGPGAKEAYEAAFAYIVFVQQITNSPVIILEMSVYWNANTGTWNYNIVYNLKSIAPNYNNYKYYKQIP